MTPPRAEVMASKHAAGAFLAGYLPYSYGHRRGKRIPAASTGLRHELAAQPPRVPARERRRHARVVELQSDGVSHQHASVTALVDEGRRRYTIAIELARTRAGWVVTSLEN